MHQIRLRLGPDPAGGANRILGVLLLRGGRGGKGGGEGRGGREGKGEKGEGREGVGETLWICFLRKISYSYATAFYICVYATV